MIKKIVIGIVAAIMLLVLTGLLMLHFFNHPIAPNTDTDKIKVVCVGDSITYGAAVPLTRSFRSYPAYLQELFGSDYRVFNFGLSGRTLLAEGDVPYVDEDFYGKTLSSDADIFIIMLGTNDSKPFNWGKGDYVAEYVDMVNAYRDACPDADIYLMQPSKCFPVDGKIKYGISNDVIESEIYDDVAQVAQKCGVNLIDLYSYTEDHPEWFDDGIHPNPEGNQKIAEYIYECLN